MGTGKCLFRDSVAELFGMVFGWFGVDRNYFVDRSGETTSFPLFITVAHIVLRFVSQGCPSAHPIRQAPRYRGCDTGGTLDASWECQLVYAVSEVNVAMFSDRSSRSDGQRRSRFLPQTRR